MASLSLSRLDVASSRIEDPGSARIARAIATRWRCPPESLTPRSPTTVSYCFSNSSMNSSAVRDPADLAISSGASRRARERCSRRSCRRRGSCPGGRRRAARGSRAAGPRSGRARRRARGPDSGRLKAMTRPMSVLFPEPLEPTSAVVVPAGAGSDVLQDRTPGSGIEADVLELDAPRRPGAARASRPRRPRSGLHQLADPIEAGEGLGDLRADRRDLDHRHGHQAGEEDVHEVADRHLPREDRRGRRR